MERSVFVVRKMDCGSEENLIRMKLSGIAAIRTLEFDIPNRKLAVIHDGNLEVIKNSIDSLNFSSSLERTETIDPAEAIVDSTDMQSALLMKVLIINFSFFIAELVAGLVARSMGLLADSLDMLADAFVYGLSLIAVGSTVRRKKNIAGISGYFQLALAIIGLIEVVRRFIGFDQVPDFKMMMIVSLLALVANALCLFLLQQSKSREPHMKASMIFTSNDVIINLGVMVAGVFVFLLHSKYPDLIIGAIVFALVTRGAFSILQLSK
jgi:Co/Zn/Cd efflux system component